MRKIFLLFTILLSVLCVKAQYLKVYHHQFGEPDSAKYFCDNIESLDYTMFDGSMVVLFVNGAGEDYSNELIDSLCFFEEDPDFASITDIGGPSIKMQYIPENATISLEPGVGRAFNVTTTRGASPLKRFEIFMDGALIGEASLDEAPDLCNLSFMLSQEEEQKVYVEFVTTDAAGEQARTGVWINSIFLNDNATTVPDCFAYYPKSWFRFWCDKGDETDGKQQVWKVKDYDHSTGVATVIVYENGDSTNVLRLKRNHQTGALETATVDGSTSKNLTDKSKSWDFLYGYRTKVPTSLLGSMQENLKYTANTDGSVSVVSSVNYRNSSSDRYGYSYDLSNTYKTGLGFTNLSWYSRNDQSGPSATFHSNMKLIAYYVEQPDGSSIYKESEVPPAPVITSVTTKTVMRDVWTQRYQVDVPKYSFTYNGSTVIDFVFWHYDAAKEEFVKDLPEYFYSYYWMTYNSKYKKVPNFGYNVEKGKREFTIIPRSADGWTSNHIGNHYMVLTGRNAAGYGSASNIFTLIVDNTGWKAGKQDPESSTLKSMDVEDEKVKEAYQRLLKSIETSNESVEVHSNASVK